MIDTLRHCLTGKNRETAVVMLHPTTKAAHIHALETQHDYLPQSWLSCLQPHLYVLQSLAMAQSYMSITTSDHLPGRERAP